MKFSNFFIPTFKEDPSDASLKSHILMLKSGMIKQETSGIYTWMPLGYRVLKKIINFIEKEISIKPVDYYFTNSIARSSKTMNECRRIKKKFLFTGIDKAS